MSAIQQNSTSLTHVRNNLSKCFQVAPKLGQNYENKLRGTTCKNDKKSYNFQVEMDNRMDLNLNPAAQRWHSPPSKFPS